MACADPSTCTIDRCVESTRSCEHEPRDADGDGEAVWNCGGSDCDDQRAEVNAAAAEVCGNAIDDDCDGTVDEADCVAPRNDTCADALVIEGSGEYELSLTAAQQDYSLSCVEPQGSRRDVVAALVVPPGPAQAVDVVVLGDDSGLGLALAGSCSDPSSEMACAVGSQMPDDRLGYVARVIALALPPGTYPLFASGVSDAGLRLLVNYAPASSAPSNETCGTAAELSPGEPVLARISGTTLDVSHACEKPVGELFYHFALSEPKDVVLTATALDAYGLATLSLRSSTCNTPQSELDCRSGGSGRLFSRALPAGDYFVALGASGPSDVELDLALSEPSSAPFDEGCAAPPTLSLGVTQDLDLLTHQNTFQSSCLPGAVDATYSLEVAQRSDLLLVERLSVGDSGALSLLAADCNAKSSRFCQSAPARALCTCSSRNGSVCSQSEPLRARAYDVRPGTYSVVVESAVGAPAQLTAYARPTEPATLVALGDTCEDALTIPESGGRFIGNTANAHADYSASCDFGTGDVAGAPDQILKLHLSEPRRVILDAAGSDYATILVLRSAGECPGREIEQACSLGCSAARSFLDFSLPAGDYYVQIDGYVGGSGRWLLDVFFGDPR
ncbi:MAG: MopE-related protein [Polyangiaceae bacterium]